MTASCAGLQDWIGERGVNAPFLRHIKAVRADSGEDRVQRKGDRERAVDRRERR